MLSRIEVSSETWVGDSVQPYGSALNDSCTAPSAGRAKKNAAALEYMFKNLQKVPEISQTPNESTAKLQLKSLGSLGDSLFMFEHTDHYSP